MLTYSIIFEDKIKIDPSHEIILNGTPIDFYEVYELKQEAWVRAGTIGMEPDSTHDQVVSSAQKLVENEGV